MALPPCGNHATAAHLGRGDGSVTVRQAAILAGGAGQKCWPYTTIRPKALLPVGNRPIVDRLVEQLRDAGIKRIAVATGNHPVAMRRHLSGAEDVTPVEDDGVGTAEAFERCLDALDRTEPVLVCYGDVVTADRNVVGIADTLTEDAGLDGMVLIDPMPREDPRGWIAAQQADGELTRFVGAARSGSHRFGGIAAFRPSAYHELAGGSAVMDEVPVGGMPDQEATLEAAVNAAQTAGSRIGTLETESLHVDVDKPWHVLEANHRLARDRVGRLEEDDIHPEATIDESARIDGNVHAGANATIGRDVHIRGNVWIEPDAVITDGAMVGGNCIIGSDATLADYCRLRGTSVVGRGCRLRQTTEFGGVLFPGVAIVHYGQLTGVVGRHTDIGAGTVSGGLRFDDARSVHETNGFKEMPENGANSVYLGDHARTGVNVTLLPGVTVGTYACVGPGAIVEEDVPDRTLLRVHQERTEHEWGPERYGW